MIYNKLSGSTINNYKKLLFREFSTEKCYLGFSRSDATWGTCALINITSVEGSFVDKNSNVTLADRLVYIYTSDDEITYTQLVNESLDLSNLYMEYLNDSWCMIRNFPPDYKNFINTTFNTNFYIFDATRTSKLKINLKESPSGYITEKVALYQSNTLSTSVNLIFANIDRDITSLGEISYYGLLDSLFTGTTKEQELIDIKNNVTSYFYFANPFGNQITERVKLQTNYLENKESIFFYDSNDKKYLLFKGDTVSIKLSFDSSATEYAIYNESLPFSFPITTHINNVTDANPPALSKEFLNWNTVAQSIFEVQSYIKLQTENISFVKEIKEEEVSTWVAKGLTVENIVVESQETFASFKYTNIRPKPNGELYSNDRVLYLWSNVFFKDDYVSILGSPPIKIVAIDNSISSITLEKDINMDIFPATQDSLYYETAQIKTTTETNKENVVWYATCSNINDALKYNMDSVKIDIYVPKTGTNLYDGIYRQLFISSEPFYYDVATSSKLLCSTSSNIYFTNDESTTLYDQSDSNKYDIGTLIYLANKIPVYRKYIKTGAEEHFTIVI